MNPKEDIKLLSPLEMKSKLTFAGFEPYRAKQILDWIWKKRVTSFDELKNIPLVLKEFLDKNYFICSGKVEKCVISADGTKKFLITFPGDTFIESVFIPSIKHNTLCISTQSGCAVSCVFCATGKMGFKRNLEAGEILEQIILAEGTTGKKVGNIVIMGMGEPLNNYSNVIKAVRIMNADYALKIGARRITLSTIGIPDKIKKLGQEKDLIIRLSVSLHAPADTLRSKLVPWNKRFRIKEILEACRYYSDQAKKYVSFEYLLIKGVNDSLEDAIRLSKILKGWKARVNLIPFNQISSSPFECPEKKEISRFASVLKKNGINTTVRKERGSDIAAACGQLGLMHKHKPVVGN